tara:strand:+ start:966 stop:2792 length:1827 start_codon:yes stop_codon:yes gene_type:complete
MKLNRNNLFRLILEAVEDDDQFYIDKIVGQLTNDPSREHIVGTYDIFEQLSPFFPEEVARELQLLFLEKVFGLYGNFGEVIPDHAMKEFEETNKIRDVIVNDMGGVDKLSPENYDLYVKSIVVGSDRPAEQLLEMGYDFHQLCYEAFGFYPPKNEKFKMWDLEGKDEMTLRFWTDVDDDDKTREVEFEFWFDLQGPSGWENANVVIEPFMRFETKDDDDGWVMLISGGLSFDYGNYSDKKAVEITKEELPTKLREAMGIPWNEDIKEWPELPHGVPPADEEILQESDDEDDSYLDLIKNKLEEAIATRSWEHYVQFFDFIDTFDDSGLISQQDANKMREKLWKAVFAERIYGEDNFNDIVQLLRSHTSLPEELRKDLEHSIYYYGIFAMSEEWALEFVLNMFGAKLEVYDPENLYEIYGVDQDTLEEIKDKLIEFGEEEDHFEVYTETGGLMFGALAQPFVHFEKKIEEIFGAKPSGRLMFGGGSWATISIKEHIDGEFMAPMVGKEVGGEIMFEWSPDTEYGMEITLIPTKLASTPQGILEDYYGIWVSTSQEGPNKGELEIGIQNYEDELADHTRVQNKKGTYGFSVEEMKEKIKEMTGIDLNEIN